MKNHLKQKTLTTTILILILLTTTPLITSTTPLEPELEIQTITGGIGKVCIVIKNNGNTTAEDVISTISVTGGLFNQIDSYKVCSGCTSCNTSIAPGETKTECTDQFIFGIGPVDIIATANATGLPSIEKTTTGFVLGPFILVK